MAIAATTKSLEMSTIKAQFLPTTLDMLDNNFSFLFIFKICHHEIIF